MKSLFSISLALLILLSNIGITFTSHFCGGETVLASISIGQHELNCGMSQASEYCLNISDVSSLEKTPCCENRFHQMSLDDEYETITLNKKQFNNTYPLYLVCVNLIKNQHTISLGPSMVNYSPPVLLQNIPVELQTFII